MPDATEVVGKKAEKVDSIDHAIHNARNRLFGGTLRKFGLKFIYLLHANVATFSHLDVLFKFYRTSTEQVVVTRKNVFREIYSLGSFTNPPVLHEEKLVK